MTNRTFSVSLSTYWYEWLTRIVESGIRHSRAQVVSEALSRHRRLIEAEMEEFLQLKAEQAERREARNERI